MGCRDLPKNTLEMADLSKKTLLLSAESCTDSVSIVVTFGRILWLRRLARSYHLGDSKLRKTARVTKILLANGSNRWGIAKKSYRTPLKVWMRNLRKI